MRFSKANACVREPVGSRGTGVEVTSTVVLAVDVDNAVVVVDCAVDSAFVVAVDSATVVSAAMGATVFVEAGVAVGWVSNKDIFLKPCTFMNFSQTFKVKVM